MTIKRLYDNCARAADRLLVAYVCSLVLLMLLSWVGDVYEWGMRNLLDGEGTVWILSQLTENFRRAPLAEIVLLLLCASLLVESGLITMLYHRPHSLRERRASQFVLVYVIVSLVVLAVLFVTSSHLVISSLGTFVGSPLERASFPLTVLWAMVMALIYGVSSSRLLGLSDALRASGRWLARVAPAFVTLFFAAQLIAALCYAFPLLASLPVCVRFVKWILYGLPVLLHLLSPSK